MLSPIDESAEDAGDGTARHLSAESEDRKSLPQMVGGHGPWQLRHWLVYATAGFCASMHLFSVYPFSSADDCNCLKDTDTSAALQQDIMINKTCFYGAFLSTKQDAANCSNVGLVIYAKCIYFIGMLLSGLTAHLLVFKFGKRGASLASGLFLVASSAAVGWAQNAATYLVLRLVISYGMTNVYLLSISSLKEFVGEEYVLVYGLTGHIGWALAHLILPLAVWLTGDWMGFSISAACMCLVLFILLCFIPESVESYLSKGLNARAQKVIRRAAWSNGYHTQDVEYFTQGLYQQKTQQEDLKTMSKQVDFRRCFELLLRFLIGFSASFLYLATLSLTDWRGGAAGERGASFALLGTAEVAAALVLLFAACFVAPRHLWAAATVMAAGAMLLMYAKASEASPLSTSPHLVATFGSSAAFTIVLMRTLFAPSSDSKWDATVTGAALCIGAAAAALADMQKFHDFNPKLLVIFAIPNLTIGASIAVIPERYFTF